MPNPSTPENWWTSLPIIPPLSVVGESSYKTGFSLPKSLLSLWNEGYGPTYHPTRHDGQRRRHKRQVVVWMQPGPCKPSFSEAQSSRYAHPATALLLTTSRAYPMTKLANQNPRLAQERNRKDEKIQAAINSAIRAISPRFCAFSDSRIVAFPSFLNHRGRTRDRTLFWDLEELRHRALGHSLVGSRVLATTRVF